jgi:hypothetical protein
MRATAGGLSLCKYVFHLLPDCFASIFPGSLIEIEGVVIIVEDSTSLEKAAYKARSDQVEDAVEIQGAIRWTRRRINLIRATLAVLIVLMPKIFSGCKAEIKSFRKALNVDFALPALRVTAADYLNYLPPPVGFGPYSTDIDRIVQSARQNGLQQDKGPDPPPKVM